MQAGEKVHIPAGVHEIFVVNISLLNLKPTKHTRVSEVAKSNELGGDPERKIWNSEDIFDAGSPQVIAIMEKQ